MDNKKDLSTDVKTVLHGEVLGPEEVREKSKEQEEIERLKAELAQRNAEKESYIKQEVNMQNQYVNQQYYANNYNYYNQLGGQFQRPKSNSFGCMNHNPIGPWRCMNCGYY